MNNWKTYTLEQVCLKITDGAHNSPASVSVGKPMASVKDLTRWGVNLSSARKISESDYDKLVKQGCRPKIGDVLIAKDGNSALDTVCNVKTEIEAVLLSSIAILRPNTHIIESDFLKYVLDSSQTREYLKNNYISGAAIPRVVLKDFKIACIEIPSLSIQKKISSILSSLDDKIEINLQMNQTLEAIAQAIFKEWFVDFNFPGATGDMEESELGMIPKGWRVLAAYETAEFINGGAYKETDFCSDNSGFPVIKIFELKYGITGQTRFSQIVKNEKCRIDNGDILFSWSGSPDTSIDTFIWAGNAGVLNQHIFRVINNSIDEKYYEYYLLKHLNPIFVEIARDKQTTGLGHVTVQDMKRVKVVYPDKKTLGIFAQKVGPVFEQVLNNSLQSAMLAQVRDFLLPKLMSGELEV